ncbi:MAG: hypothetical protein H6697_12395, partial [Myxococcales bacterium]|nr:hypothetical protein [Myxococcales bacterium]
MGSSRWGLVPSGRHGSLRSALLLALPIGAATVASCGDDAEEVATVPVFDLVSGESAIPEYAAEVDRVDVIDFRVEAPSPRPLYVGHSVDVHISVDVEAEPFETDLTVGLADDAGNKCIIGRLDAAHMPEMFDAAELANQNIAEHQPDIAEPSFASCDPGDACPNAGEECLGFAELGEDGTLDVSHWCASTTWAAAATYAAQGLAVRIDPGDLTGSVFRTYDLVHTDIVPESCAPLVGANGVHAWLAFDTAGLTDTYGREDTVDEVTEAPTTFDEGEPDPEALERLDLERAFALAFSAVADVGGSLGADPGADLQVEHVLLPSSVVPIHAATEASGAPPEIDATVVFDVEGGSPATRAALAGASTNLRFELAPYGEPASDCLSEGADLAALRSPVTLAAVHQHADGSEEAVDDEAIATSADAQHSHSVELRLPDATRAAIVDGDLGCFTDFTLTACASTGGSQATGGGVGSENDCASAALRFDTATFAPPAEGEEVTDDLMGETINAETDPERMLDDAVEFGTGGTCSEGLIAEYQRLRTEYEQSLINARVSQYYTTAWDEYVRGHVFAGGWYHCNTPSRGYIIGNSRHIPQNIVSAVLDCTNSYAQTGNVNAQRCWLYQNGPSGGCFESDYWQIIRPYFLPGTYDRFRSDPTTFTDDTFAFACDGLVSGSACPSNPADVPSFIAQIRELLRNIEAIKARGGNMSELPSNWRAFADRLGGRGGNRCSRYGIAMLQRTTVTESGVESIAEDGAFYDDIVPELCLRADLRRRADAVWAQITQSCTDIAKPFDRAATGVHSGQFVNGVYQTYSATALSIRGTMEGGVMNRWYVDRDARSVEAVVGPQARVYVEGEGDLDFLRVHDIFRVYALAHVYNDLLSSYAEYGLHALTHDLYHTEFRFPSAEYELPSPPPLAKEAERCRYLYKPPIPARLHLCGGVGGEVGMGLSIGVEHAGEVGDPDDSDTWPELQGAATPYVSIKTFASAAIDTFILEAGARLNLDPTVGVELPIQTGVRFFLFVHP